MKQPKEDQYEDEMNEEHKKDIAEETEEQNDDNNVHISHVASSEYKFYVNERTLTRFLY